MSPEGLAENITIPAPTVGISDSPDQFTATSPDFTGDHAENRILHINLRWFKYGTDDKSHASAIVLSLVLLLLAVIVAVIGAASMYSGKAPDWLETLITWIGNAFLFTAGVAIGKSDKGQVE
jgi:hypothetical protein